MLSSRLARLLVPPSRRLTIACALLLATAAGPARAQTTDALLDTLQHAAFNFFWNEANPTNGMVRDRDTPGSVSSIACTGFGLSAIAVGVDHGWITRQQARDRVLTTLTTLWTGPQGSAVSGTIGNRGLFYHWLDMNTARRTWDSELSTIDTALLFAGILDAKQFFATGDPQEVQIRALADSIVRRANWNFMRNLNPGILMGWKPNGGFAGFGQWIGYNEAMILYILALGSPTNPVPTSAWTTWTSGYDWDTQYGYSFVTFPPLFGHQYSHCWIDFRNIQDAYMRGRGIDYFENSRRATLAQHAYSVANPFGWTGYSDSLWGITASDVPSGYLARGAPPAENDDGTITPTAPISSIAFAPEVVTPVVHKLWNQYRPQLWSAYGWNDAFNPTQNWFGPDVLGIDQGPMVLMIENYRTGRVWQRFMQNPEIQIGLQRAGFLPVSNAAPPPEPGLRLELRLAPNPVRDRAAIHFQLPTAGRTRVALYDVAGRELRRVVDGVRSAGPHAATLESAGLAAGLYYVRVDWNGRSVVQRLVRLD